MILTRLLNWFGKRRTVMGEERGVSNEAVIRILYEIEKRLGDRIEDAAEANAKAIEASTDAIVAAIQALGPINPPPEADTMVATLVPNQT
jgi:hypothetical protein